MFFFCNRYYRRTGRVDDRSLCWLRCPRACARDEGEERPETVDVRQEPVSGIGGWVVRIDSTLQEEGQKG